MGRVPYSEYNGSRTRFQRLSDQQIFAGWLQSLQNDIAIVTAEESVQLDLSERFLFQVQGPSADAYFIATSTGVPSAIVNYIEGSTAKQAVSLQAQKYEFKIFTQIQLKDAHQQARKAIHTMGATLHACGKTSEALISDASSGGMGIIAWEEVQRGDVVKVDLTAESLQASFNCEVRHCRPEDRLIGAYRVGLQFRNPDRLSHYAWRKLIAGDD